MRQKISLQQKLIRIFLITSALPILIMSFFSYYNISITLQDNVAELTLNNLKQVEHNFEISLASYEDLLYQMYTSDDVVKMVDKLNDGVDEAVTRGQLVRLMRGLLSTKEYIRSITVITSKGEMITYDELTSVTNENPWIRNFSMSESELFESVSADNSTHIFPTEYATSFAYKDYYLFHMAHRIINYKDLQKQSGIVIISMDEEFLRDICVDSVKANGELDNFNFLVDGSGNVISFVGQDELTQNITGGNESLTKRQEEYEQFIGKLNIYKEKYTSITVYESEKLGWDIIHVSNQSSILSSLSRQWMILIAAGLIAAVTAIGLTFFLSRQLASSVTKVVTTMREASGGDMTARVSVDKEMPQEIETIAFQFNDMLEKVEQSRQNEKEAGDKQRIAEVKALEAQINPHFLYNTLDTINWMAINRNEYDISNAISALATILRYAILNSNETVPIKDEIEWLKKYIFLQQNRLKCRFACQIDVDLEVVECRIYKLLLQPFVENAMIHGFKEPQKEYSLKVRLKQEDDLVRIVIEDNGVGMEPEQVERLNCGKQTDEEKEHHIGMENVISRLKMYYGEGAAVIFASEADQGTKVTLMIPWRM